MTEPNHSSLHAASMTISTGGDQVADGFVADDNGKYVSKERDNLPTPTISVEDIII